MPLPTKKIPSFKAERGSHTKSACMPADQGLKTHEDSKEVGFEREKKTLLMMVKTQIISSLKDLPSVCGSSFCSKGAFVGANKFQACLAGTGHPLECSARWCLHLRTRATETAETSRKVAAKTIRVIRAINSGRMHQETHLEDNTIHINSHPRIAGLAHGTFQQIDQALYSTSHQQPWKQHRQAVDPEFHFHPPSYCIPIALPNVEGHNASEVSA